MRRWLAPFANGTRRTVAFWLAVSAVVGSLVVMNEIARLVAGIRTSAGVVHSLTDVIGPAALANTSAWADWLPHGERLGILVLAHSLLDVLMFVPAYVALLFLLVRRSRTARWALLSLVVIEIVEFALLAWMAVGMTQGTSSPTLATVTAVASTLKWIALLVTLAAGAANGRVRAQLRAGTGDLLAVIRRHRIVFVAIAIVAVVTLGSGGDVLEQLPDVQRQWLNGGENLLGFGWVIIVYTAFAVSAFLIGRQRSKWAWQASLPGSWTRAERRPGDAGRPDDDAAEVWATPRPLARLIPWLLVGVALLAIALMLTPDSVDWRFAGVPIVLSLVLVGVSALIRRRRADEPYADRGPMPRLSTDRARLIRRGGDILAISLLSLALLGLAKAAAGPFFTRLVFREGAQTAWDVVPWAFALCLLVGVAVLPVLAAMLQRVQLRAAANTAGRVEGAAVPRTKAVVDALLAQEVPVPTTEHAASGTDLVAVWIRRSFTIVAALFLAVAIIEPLLIAGLGVAAAAVGMLASWTVLLSALVLWLADRQPLEIFRAMHLRSVPVLTLLVVPALLVGLVGGAPQLHAIATDPEHDPDYSQDGVADRDDLAEAFERWETTASASCGGSDPLPLLLIAAEGGGIRAASWTVDVLNVLAQGECSSSAALLSSGVSGGSVGLSIISATPRDEQAEVDAVGVGNQRALAEGVIGLLGRDLLGGSLGLRIPPSHPWIDRAGRIEQAWEEGVPGFAEAFDFEPSATTGYLVLNSTAATIDCKVIISQIDLDGAEADPDLAGPRCDDDASSVLSATIDLHDFFGSCELDLTRGTAAMLSARFPVITPAGRVSSETLGEGCEQVDDLQLIDGGYIDNTGLGTLETIAPALAELIDEHNETSARPIVPVIVYISNSPGDDIVRPTEPVQADFAIPLASRATAPFGQLTANARLMRLAALFDRVCPVDDAACHPALGLEGPVVYVAPDTRPAIAVPLGWTLSSFTVDQLRRAVRTELGQWTTSDGCPADGAAPGRTPYNTLGDLMCALEPDGTEAG